MACAMMAPDSNSSPCLVVYMDNQNTADIWHSLKASTPYNTTLICGVTSLIKHETDAHVLHVPGIKNVVANALSQFNNVLAV